MRRILLLLTLALLFTAFLIGCSDDIVLESESDISGHYSGSYVVIEEYGSAEAKEHTQLILFEFIDSTATYIMQIDTEKEFDSTFSVCRVDGKFLLTEGVTLLQLHSIPDEDAGQNACDAKFNPEGLFTLIKGNSSDSLRLTQFDNTKRTFKEIKIAKAVAE